MSRSRRTLAPDHQWLLQAVPLGSAGLGVQTDRDWNEAYRTGYRELK